MLFRSNQIIIGTENGKSSNWTVQRLVLSGGDSYYDGEVNHGEGGDIYLWAGRGEDGGDIKVDAGNSLGSGSEGGTVKVRGGSGGYGGFVEISAGYGSQTYGGHIEITAGQGNTSGGYVNVTGGYGTYEKGGDVTISGGGSNLGADYYGNVYIVGGVSSWNFSNNKTLIMPTDADIKNADGISVIKSIPQNIQGSMAN